MYDFVDASLISTNFLKLYVPLDRFLYHLRFWFSSSRTQNV